jgi:signal transduction histidine kinase
LSRFSLRSVLAGVLLLLAVYFAGAVAAYWIQSKADTALAESFDKDLASLTRLPALQEDIRQALHAADVYLLTGSPAHLAERGRWLARVSADLDDLDKLIGNGQELEVFHKLRAAIGERMAREDAWIARRRAGKLTHEEAILVVSRRHPLEGAIEPLLHLRNAYLYDLESRRLLGLRATQTTLAVILLTGFLAALTAARTLQRFVVSPLVALEGEARAWRLGQSWSAHTGPASAEVELVRARLGEMAERLNEQYRREAELSQLKTQLVSVMSHEFNNALTVIQGVAALLEETETSAKPGERREYYQMLKANIRSLSAEAMTVLQMGRLESGEFALSLKPTDLAGVLTESVARLRLLHERKRHEVRVDVPDEPVLARADSEALALVVTNLLTNAIKYTPQGGRITLSLRPEGDSVRVGVADTGIGVAPEDQERIFSGYFRTEAGKAQARGFGVGLALARRIVEAHGSRLELDSAPGKGSDFHFSLRVWKADVAEVVQ